MHFRFAPKATVGTQKSDPSVCAKTGHDHVIVRISSEGEVVVPNMLRYIDISVQ
jgi:hypothetical protein